MIKIGLIVRLVFAALRSVRSMSVPPLSVAETGRGEFDAHECQDRMIRSLPWWSPTPCRTPHQRQSALPTAAPGALQPRQASGAWPSRVESVSRRSEDRDALLGWTSPMPPPAMTGHDRSAERGGIARRASVAHAGVRSRPSLRISGTTRSSIEPPRRGGTSLRWRAGGRGADRRRARSGATHARPACKPTSVPRRLGERQANQTTGPRKIERTRHRLDPHREQGLPDTQGSPVRTAGRSPQRPRGGLSPRADVQSPPQRLPPSHPSSAQPGRSSSPSTVRR